MPEFAVFGAALAAFVLIYGAVMMFTLIARAIAGHTVWPISSIAGTLRSWGVTALRNMLSVLHSSASGLGVIFNWFWQAHQATNTHAQRHAAAINTRVSRVVHSTIPAAKETAIFWANAGLYKEAAAREAQIAATATDLQNNINSEVASVRTQLEVTATDLQANINAALSTALTDLTRVAGTLGGRLTALQTELDGDVSALNAEITSALGTLQATVNTAVTTLQAQIAYLGAQETKAVTTAVTAAEAGARATVNAAAAGAVAGLWPGIAVPAEQARQSITAEYPGTIDGATSIPDTVPITMAGVMAAVGTMAATAVTYVDECGVPLCNNLSGLSKVLGTLFGLLETGVLLALFAWIVANPTEAAHDASSVVDRLVAPLKALVTEVVG